MDAIPDKTLNTPRKKPAKKSKSKAKKYKTADRKRKTK